MKDRTKSGAPTAKALITVALVLAATASVAHAQEASDRAPAAEAPAAEAPAASATAPTEAAATTVSEPAATPATEQTPAPVTAVTPTPAATLPPMPAPATATTPTPMQTPADVEQDISWFARPSLTVVAGEGARQFKLTLFGFAEVDYMYDTTRSYEDAIGSSLVAPANTYDGSHGRSQFSMRNSRLGFAFESPTVGGVKPTAVLEADFFGHQDSPPETSENTYFDSPTFRVRHAYVKMETPYLDVVLGQTYDLFGWQNFSSPCSIQFLGLPNQLFSRNPQLRLSHSFGAAGPVGVDIAISAGRPAQRDSQIPDGSGGLRIVLNRWKGLTTPGNVGTRVLPAAIGVSGIVRSFRANAFAPPPVNESNTVRGWGMAIDALVPIVPASSPGERGNRLTLTGAFVRGTGIADLITSGGGVKFPPLQNPAQATPAPEYQGNVDSTLVTFDANGVAHTLNWTAFRIGLQYYLPPSGRFLFSANYTQSHSDNVSKLFPKGGSDVELRATTADTSRYADANLFWDATPALRVGISGQYTQVRYLEGDQPHNFRGMAQSAYQF